MNNNQRLIFVGGIHGVGKTTLSRRVAAILGAEHVTAGDLIRAAATAPNAAPTGISGKSVADVDANQERLLRGLQSYRAERQQSDTQSYGLLLDGHFCLLDSTEQVAEIPIGVFDALQPAAVLLVEAVPEVVARRLLDRDGGAPSIETLRAFTAREYARAAAIAKALQIPLHRAAGGGDIESTARDAAARLRPHLAPEVA